jgi:hypothetical protein
MLKNGPPAGLRDQKNGVNGSFENRVEPSRSELPGFPNRWTSWHLGAQGNSWGSGLV